jgi:hypothetical protein
LFYVNHPVLEQQHENGAFTSIANALAMCLSDVALSGVQKDDPSKPIVTEAINNAINRQWSSFLCMFALSSALHLPIELYYPTSTNEKALLDENADSLSTMFNCTIQPRVSSSKTKGKIHLFRCAYAINGKIPDRKNHFVAMCEPEKSITNDTNMQQFLMKLVAPGFDVSDATEAPMKKPNPLAESHEVSSTESVGPLSHLQPSPQSFQPLAAQENFSASQPSKKSKKKQTILDHVFPREKKVC